MIKELSLEIWGRKFTLPIVFDSLSDGIITEEQLKAVEALNNHLEWISLSKREVEKYCKEALMEDDDNEKKDNIFSYIKPERLYVTRKTKGPKVAIMCKYRYDPEHGLAIVYSLEGKIEIGSQNLIL